MIDFFSETIITKIITKITTIMIYSLMYSRTGSYFYGFTVQIHDPYTFQSSYV